MADMRFLYILDLQAAIKRHDIRYISKILLAMEETDQSISPKIAGALGKVLDPDQLRKEGRKKEHHYFIDFREQNYDDIHMAQDYIFLCEPTNRELARHICHSDPTSIMLPCHNINQFDKNRYGKKNHPTCTEIKTALCLLYNVSPRTFDTKLAAYNKAEAQRIEEDRRMWDEMFSGDYNNFIDKYVDEMRREYGEDFYDKMTSEVEEDYEIINRHFFPEDYPPDE